MDDLNQCSRKVAAGLDTLCAALSKTTHSNQEKVAMRLVAAFGACRFGSREWVDRFLVKVTAQPEMLLSHVALSEVASQLIDRFVSEGVNPMT